MGWCRYKCAVWWYCTSRATWFCSFAPSFFRCSCYWAGGGKWLSSFTWRWWFWLEGRGGSGNAKIRCVPSDFRDANPSSYIQTPCFEYWRILGGCGAWAARGETCSHPGLRGAGVSESTLCRGFSTWVGHFWQGRWGLPAWCGPCCWCITSRYSSDTWRLWYQGWRSQSGEFHSGRCGEWGACGSAGWGIREVGGVPKWIIVRGAYIQFKHSENVFAGCTCSRLDFQRWGNIAWDPYGLRHQGSCTVSGCLAR